MFPTLSYSYVVDDPFTVDFVTLLRASYSYSVTLYFSELPGAELNTLSLSTFPALSYSYFVLPLLVPLKGVSISLTQSVPVYVYVVLFPFPSVELVILPSIS